MDILAQKSIVTALSKVLKEGISFDLQYYDRIGLTKKCATILNASLIPQGYSVVVSDLVNLDVYYVKISQKLCTINVTETGVHFPKGTKKEILAGISPVITLLIETLTDLSEN